MRARPSETGPTSLRSPEPAGGLVPSGDDPARVAHLEDVLRGLASYVGCGGYNAPTVDPDIFDQKIRAGIDMVIGPWVEDAKRYRCLRMMGAAPGHSLHLENRTVLVTTNLDKWLDDTLEKGRPPAPSHAVTYSERYGFKKGERS